MQVISRAKALLSAGVALTIGLLFWEGITEALIFRVSPRKGVPGLGFVSTGGREVQSSEGYAVTMVDKDGYRGVAPEKRPDYVVLALGDSYTEAMQVSDQQSFCGLLQQHLTKRGLNAWVANAGVPGASPARYVYVAPWYKKHLNPNRVVVEINEGDFKDDLLNASAEDHLVLTANGYKLIHLNLVHRFAGAKSSLFHLFVGRFGAGEEKADTASGKTSIDYKGLVHWAVENLKGAYGNPILVYVPTIDYFSPSEPIPEVEGDLAAECSRDGVDYVNMRADFLEHFQKTHDPCNGFDNTEPGVGHINALGHALVARDVNRFIDADMTHPR